MAPRRDIRIAQLVDIHGRFDAVRQAHGEIGDIDLLIVGGDITTGGTPDGAQRAIEAGGRWLRDCSRWRETWTLLPLHVTPHRTA